VHDLQYIQINYSSFTSAVKNMEFSRIQFKTVDEYMTEVPKNVREILEELRRVIKESVPEAEETISYGMPTFNLDGKSFAHFAAHKNHIGFYPAGSSAIEAFKKELSSFKTSKGAIQFPLDKPIPFDLVKKIVKFKVREIELKKKTIQKNDSLVAQN